MRISYCTDTITEISWCFLDNQASQINSPFITECTDLSPCTNLLGIMKWSLTSKTSSLPQEDSTETRFREQMKTFLELGN